jgi:Toxin SymE, type I toxin-antitoxin system
MKPPSMKTLRRLTVGHRGAGDSGQLPHRPRPRVPTLRMQGRWLDRAGFGIGACVRVEVMEGRPVLEVAEPRAAHHAASRVD